MGMAVSDVPHPAFASTGVGPGGNLATGITTATSLQDYMTQVIGQQSQDGDAVQTDFKTEDNYRATLETQLLNSSGVNIDEEMANLINIQTAYNASARTISVVQLTAERV